MTSDSKKIRSFIKQLSPIIQEYGKHAVVNEVSKSIDRIDNSKGHTKDNTVPCCYECNCARNNNFSFEEMKVLGKTIKQIKENRK